MKLISVWNLFILLAICTVVMIASEETPPSKSERAHLPLLTDGNIAVDEVVVESSLHIKTKSNATPYGRKSNGGA